MDIQEYNRIDEAFKEAEKDDTPFLLATEDELAVVGDANKTKVNAHDFIIKFRVPQEQEDGSVKYAVISKEFKKAYITPRQDAHIVRALTILLAYYRDVKENELGEMSISDLTAEKKREIALNMGDEIVDAMYDVTATFLGIDNELKDYMLQSSVMDATAQIITNFAEAANEADTFFGHSSARLGAPGGK